MHKSVSHRTKFDRWLNQHWHTQGLRKKQETTGLFRFLFNSFLVSCPLRWTWKNWNLNADGLGLGFYHPMRYHRQWSLMNKGQSSASQFNPPPPPSPLVDVWIGTKHNISDSVEIQQHHIRLVLQKHHESLWKLPVKSFVHLGRTQLAKTLSKQSA